MTELLGSTEKRIIKDKIAEKIPVVQSNLISNTYQNDSKV